LKPKPGRKRRKQMTADGAQADGAQKEAGTPPRARRANANPITVDETYSGLREHERVVMRHQIALNLDTFRAAPQDFSARPARSYPLLREVTSPFLSIIIATYNGLAHLQTLLPALVAQEFRDFEVIVADDASRDDSVAWLEMHYPAVRVLVNRQNRGFVATCNAAADAARGRVLVFLNNDTEPEPGWAGALARAVCQYPRAGLFASKLLLFERRDVLHSAGDLLGVDGVPRNRGVWQTDTGQYDTALQVFGGCGGAVAYRRDLWSALGGFDESFWMYLEDADFAFRAQLLGWDAVFVPEARVYHRLSATGGGTLASYYVGRNTLWLIAKNMPRGLLLRALPKVLAAQARIAWDALVHWRGAAARARLAGQLAGLVGIGTALRRRRQIQPRRVREDRELAARLAG
jgi:GT2 family glycosyltransferase